MHSPAYAKLKRALEELQRVRAAARRHEEQTLLDLHELSWQSAQTTKRLVGRVIPHHIVEHKLRDLIERDPASDARLPRFKAHLAALATKQGVVIRYVGQWPQAYALFESRTIEMAEVRTPETYVAGLHELGHLVNPCRRTHQRARVDEHTTLCVACETIAWNYATTEAMTWTWAMHRELTRALTTYRPYATAAERVVIDAQTSRTGFRLAWLDAENRAAHRRRA